MENRRGNTNISRQGDHEKPENNRPISLLPILSKVCERIALNQFVPYLESNKRLSSTQSGNRQFHSTETSLVHTTDAVLEAIDKKKTTAVVLLDMSKAFDSTIIIFFWINYAMLVFQLLLFDGFIVTCLIGIKECT